MWWWRWDSSRWTVKSATLPNSLTPCLESEYTQPKPWLFINLFVCLVNWFCIYFVLKSADLHVHIFCRVFELNVSFPLETELILTVFDHDLVGSDDVIGETRIDLENRFFSRHRAGCGLALYYDKWVTTAADSSITTTIIIIISYWPLVKRYDRQYNSK